MIPPSIRVVLDSPVPVYRQIAEQTRAHIAEGSLVAGAELPSVRDLARQLGIHFNTVADAYRLLADEGYIDLSHGKRARILGRPGERTPSRTEIDSFRGKLRQLLAEMRWLGMSEDSLEREVLAAVKGERA